MHANLPLWKPYIEPGQHEFINGANFASAAATVLPENNPLKEIYEMGGRKFAFQNVAPCGCSTQAKQENNLTINECYDEMLEFPKLHNNALVNATKELEIQLPEFKYMIFVSTLHYWI
ncbi:hypothetical protein Dsin_014145 [Dipteronia sinensis]|uniref:Uncharacterized protein n=1 Tax=Dipteronia sinensis TaxID=43782 RepID=A0AAE0AM21_9ROSI|nr:hypothetical protein Dsin_014145 [Dipteronia sinensis]